MNFEILYVIFMVITVLNYIFLDIKVDKMKKESLDKDQVIASLIAHNKALCKLNTGFKDHERRLNNIEKPSLSEKPEEPEYTCENCKFYDFQHGPVFKCKRNGWTYVNVCNKACELFEKKESLDEDENTFYVNNVKIDISSKSPHVVYKTDGLSSREYIDLVSKLYYSD